MAKKAIKSLSIGVQVLILCGSILLAEGLVVQVLPDWSAARMPSFLGATLAVIGGNIVNFLLGRVVVPKVYDGGEVVTEVEDGRN